MKLGAKKWWWIGSIVVVVITGVVLAGRNKANSYTTATVDRADLTQIVSVSGTVKPASEVNLGLPTSGRVATVSAQVGDRVTAGQLLVALEQGQLGAQLRQAQAGVLSSQALLSQYQAAVTREQAKLDELLRGSLPEEIAIKKDQLATAEQDLSNDYATLSTTVNDAYNKADDAVRVKTSAMFSGNINLDYSLTFNTCNSQAAINATAAREQSESDLTKWLTELNQLSAVSSQFEWDQTIIKAKAHLQVYNNFLIALNSVLTDSCLLNNSTYDTYRTNLSTARTAINTALTNVGGAEQDIAAQKIIISRIKNELDLVLAGTPVEQISAQRAALKQAEANLTSQQAQVQQAQANVQAIQAQLGQSVIRAPFAGLVTKQEAKVGEIASGGTSLVSVISDNQYQIEAFVPEADIAKLTVSDQAEVTLDAYGSEVIFQAAIVAIEPAETVIEGLATYKVVFQFTQDDERIKSGMTANIDITTDSRTQVLAIPQRAITIEDSKRIVQLLEISAGKEVPIDRTVETGIVGIEGLIEITSGLEEGDRVVTGVSK